MQVRTGEQEGRCLTHHLAEARRWSCNTFIAGSPSPRVDRTARVPTDVERHGPVRSCQLFAKMLINGQFTMKPVAWNVLLSVPAGVMLRACVPTRASALAQS